MRFLPLLAAPLEGHGWGMPHDASLDGWRIDDLINETSLYVILLFVIMVAWMLWACLQHGERHPARFDHGTSRGSITVALGIAAAIFFVVDGRLLVNSILVWNHVFGNFAWAETQPGVVRIEINAHQWSWAARYPGPDGKFGTQDDIVTLNDVTVPQGVPVIFQVASIDVLHSFNIPNMRVKMDAVPGMINRVWFVAKETGQFDIGCAQHCGANHYKMRGVLTVLPRADWERWAKEASDNSSRAYDPEDKDAHWAWDWEKHARI
jgi:cytochrome c oxidase subunit 2